MYIEKGTLCKWKELDIMFGTSVVDNGVVILPFDWINTDNTRWEKLDNILGHSKAERLNPINPDKGSSHNMYSFVIDSIYDNIKIYDKEFRVMFTIETHEKSQISHMWSNNHLLLTIDTVFCIINLNERYKITYESNPGFKWLALSLNPNKTKLAMFGDMIGATVARIYDFSNPEQFPYKELAQHQCYDIKYWLNDNEMLIINNDMQEEILKC